VLWEEVLSFSEKDCDTSGDMGSSSIGLYHFPPLAVIFFFASTIESVELT